MPVVTQDQMIPSYGTLQGEAAPLVHQHQDGSDNYSGPKPNGRAKYPTLVIAIGFAAIVLAIMHFQPCLHTLQRKHWRDEVAAHDQLMEDHRRHWEQEEAGHERRRVVHLQELQKWIAEKAEMDQWKANLERKRGDIFWADYRDLGCSKYSKRRHSATLTNVPAGLNPRKECELKPMYIYDQWVVPTWCEDPQLCGKMTGHWEVESNLCKPYISKYEDHGCIRRKTRQYKGKLEDIQDWGSWHKICMTMSGFYDGIDLGHPYFCSACNDGGCGYWAEWTVEDHTCG